MTLAATPPRNGHKRNLTAAEFQQRYERKVGMSTDNGTATAPAPPKANGNGNGTGTVVMNKPKRKKVARPKLEIKTGDQGTPQKVHKDAILIDRDAYQRVQNSTKVQGIAKDWSPVAAGAVILARRGDNQYAAVDGAHRVLAARLRPDVEYLNAIVFDTADVKDEAAAFLVTNTNRRPVTAIEKFRAQITAGDEAVQLADQLLAEAGVKISHKPTPGTRSTKSVGTIVRCIRLDKDVFLSVWPVILKLCGEGPIHSRVIDTLFYIERRLVGTPASLTRGIWHERLLKLDADTIVRETSAFAAVYQRNGEAVWGKALVEVLNRNMRSNRLVLPEEAATAGKVTRVLTSPTPDNPAVYETFRNAGGNAVPPGACCAACGQELTDLPHYVKQVDGPNGPDDPEARHLWCTACNPGTTGRRVDDGRGVPVSNGVPT